MTKQACAKIYLHAFALALKLQYDELIIYPHEL